MDRTPPMDASPGSARMCLGSRRRSDAITIQAPQGTWGQLPRLVWEAVGTRVAIAVATGEASRGVASSVARVAVAVSTSTKWGGAVWAIGVRAELLGELLLLSDGVLLGSNVVLVLLLLSGHELLVLGLLGLHELLALGLGLHEGLLLGLTDLLDLLGSHAVWDVWVGTVGLGVGATVGVWVCATGVVWGAVWEERHFETLAESPC